jgi:photosystem II stability/assembly factor-like uncharacterized protein
MGTLLSYKHQQPMVSDSKDLMGQIPHYGRFVSQAIGLCLAAALLVQAAPARAVQAGGQPSWVPIGPAGGSIGALAAAPGGIVYAGSLASVSRSDDGGRHWRRLPGNGLPVFGISALAVVPGRPEIIYTSGDTLGPGADQSGPYLSTDGGGSWLPAMDGYNLFCGDLGNTGPHVVAMAATVEGSAVYALGPNGCIYSTRPGSRSWSQIVLPDAAASVTADPQRPSTLYVGAATGIYRTRDGGETWSLLGSGFLPTDCAPIQMAIDPAAPGSLYALYQTFSLGYLLFHSPDDGLSWVYRRVPLPAVLNYILLAAEPGGKVLVASRMSNSTLTVLETVDGGATWVAATDAPRDDYLTALLVAPGETATVYASGPRGLWLSHDAGDRWRPSSAGLYAQLYFSLKIGSNGSSSFLYFSSFTPVPEPKVQLNFLFRRKTGGTFRPVVGAAYPVVGVDPRRPEIVYGSLSDGNLWKSYDGGLTWGGLASPLVEPIEFFGIDPASPDILYAGSVQSDPPDSLCHLSKSTDAGKTWACLLTTPDTSDLLIDPADTSNLYLLSSSGQVYISRDGGAAWRPSAQGLPPGQRVSAFALDPSDSRRLYAALQVSDQAAAVYVSNDSAGGWTRLAGGLQGPITSLKADPRHPLTLYACSTTVFRSTDGGLRWHRFDAGLPVPDLIGGFLFDPVQPGIVYTVTGIEGVYMLDTSQP